MKTTKTAASRLDRTAYTASEVKDLNRVSKLLAKFGGISVERTAHLTKMSTISAAWCLIHAGAVITGSGLYIWA